MASKSNQYIIRLIRASFGYFLAGFLVPYLWARIASPFGLLAGFVAALCAIGPVWYLVHYKGIVVLENGDIGVDMGTGIATAVFVRDSINNGWQGSIDALPTLILVIIGASLAGIAAAQVEKRFSKGEDR